MIGDVRHKIKPHFDRWGKEKPSTLRLVCEHALSNQCLCLFLWSIEANLTGYNVHIIQQITYFYPSFCQQYFPEKSDHKKIEYLLKTV